MNNVIQLKLFDDSLFIEKEKDYVFGVDCTNPNFSRYINFTSSNEMPVVAAYNSVIPEQIWGINRFSSKRNFSGCPHFFVDDRLFNSFWPASYKSLQWITRFQRVISPDFSVYADMTDAEVRFNLWRNHYLAALWQKFGVEVIPNVSWAGKKSLDYCTEGLPKGSVIAINSTGIGKDKWSKQLWQNGYHLVLDELQPKHILRYGAKQPDEAEHISTYYQNDNFKSVYYGR